MPADSESVRTWRPLGVRVVGVMISAGLLVVVAMAWFGFDQETRDKFTAIQMLTILGFGLLAGSVLYALMRSRVEAHPDRLVVVNGYRRREFTWPQVVAVHMPPGAPWATLDLANGETTSAMGIQGSDGDRARTAVRELRQLLNEHSAPEQ
ncbi:PH domain-containing protein [Nocardioides sp.]|uniref:PH domain-containing protein n=1 Tax=Nocardioides sp. TaxID=35761 RepID=UPI00356AE7FD